MKKAFILLSIALIWSACATASLFNGSDLKDWHAYGTEKWYAEDGTLVAESGPDAQYGYLCTDMAYDDFDITLEFKLEANGNSGMFIRSTVSGTKVSGWQVEIAPDKDKTGGVYESYGRGWLKLPKESVFNPLKENEWDTLTFDTKLKELELSSMQFLRVVGALEDTLGIPLDAGLGDVETVGDLIGELKKLKEAQD